MHYHAAMNVIYTMAREMPELGITRRRFKVFKRGLEIQKPALACIYIYYWGEKGTHLIQLVERTSICQKKKNLWRELVLLDNCKWKLVPKLVEPCNNGFLDSPLLESWTYDSRPSTHTHGTCIQELHTYISRSCTKND